MFKRIVKVAWRIVGYIVAVAVGLFLLLVVLGSLRSCASMIADLFR